MSLQRLAFVRTKRNFIKSAYLKLLDIQRPCDDTAGSGNTPFYNNYKSQQTDIPVLIRT